MKALQFQEQKVVHGLGLLGDRIDPAVARKCLQAQLAEELQGLLLVELRQHSFDPLPGSPVKVAEIHVEICEVALAVP